MGNERLLTVRLDLFDGAAAAGAPGAGDAAPQEGGKGEVKGAVPGTTRRGKSGGAYEGVVFGKQSGASGADETAGGQTPGSTSDAGRDKQGAVQTTSDTLEERRKSFRELVNGEFKDVYTEETQRMIDRRFRDTKRLQEQIEAQQPVIDMLLARHHIADGDMAKLAKALDNDDAFWSEAAEEAGMSVEQYKQFQKLERENARLLQAERARHGQEQAEAQMRRWNDEAAVLKGKFPAFDLSAEAKDPQFRSMLQAGVPMEHAYKVMHMDEIVTDAMRTTAADTEKRVVASVRAKGARPPENGTAAQSAFTVKDDVSKLSRQDRAEIARRVAQGETIRF